MRDFTLNIYKEFLHILLKNSPGFLPFKDYIQLLIANHSDSARLRRNQQSSIIIPRHDVDRLPANALQMAKLESELGIKGTYYFRVVPQSYDVQVIKEIAELGHEIGYHYEDVDLVIRSPESGVGKTLRQAQGDNLRINNKNEDTETIIDAAWESFKRNLEKMRNVADIKTICMHGSPRSKYDNKDIWKKHDYRELGIIGEPYLDIDFNEVLYLTDTGRCWDGYKVSIRDKVSDQQKHWEKQGLVFHSTKDIINAAEENKLPDRIMMTFHPQRWSNNPMPWTKELVMQNVKNVVKKVIVSTNN